MSILRLCGITTCPLLYLGGIIIDIYFGGCERPNAIHTLAVAGGKKVMISFAEPPTETCWNLYRKYDIELMADSGAFSAWKRGTPIDIQRYMEWIKRNDIERYFNLDVVGDVEATKHNQLLMEQEGFRPIPVFHFGEDFQILKDLVNTYELVGLGGTVGLPPTAKEQWFRQVFSLCPNGRFHALGVANARYLVQFPFASVDSVWWLYKFRDKQTRLSCGDDRKDEQRARVKYLLGLKGQKTNYQMTMF